MRIVELILDEENDISGVDAISVVERPAIEEDFIALKEEIKFAEADKDQRILIGALLVPNKPIYRNGKEEDYYVYFSKETIKKTSELFLMNGYQNNSTLEHREPLQGLSLVESWIVEDDKKDKSRYYKMEVPVGTWMGAVKVNNEEIWNDFVKTGKVKGFSIEGYFADKMERPQESLKEECDECDESCGTCKKDFNAFYEDFVEEEAEGVVDELRRLLTGVELQSFSDYPDAVKNNAKRGRELNEKQGNKCATETGKQRSADLSAGRPVTVETIKRMYSYLSRAEEYYDEGNTEACGTISYLLWGGKAGKRWSESKLKELGEIELTDVKVNDDYAIIMDRLAYSSKDMAIKIAKDIGCEGYHEHEFEGQTWYMPCEQHSKDNLNKCPYGYKKKDGKCVKMAEIGERGGVRKSPKAPKSDTPNPKPKGEGTAKGDASTTRGAVVSKKDEATLKQKSDDFNKRYKDKLGYGVNVGMLKSVFQRGLGAFNTSHSPRVKSASQWSFARVNAFLYLVRNGRPQNPKYTTDFDLLPKKHPKYNKE